MPTTKKRKKKTKYKKLTVEQKKLASKFIAEEFRTRKYSPKQATAIGISRAKKVSKKAR